MVPHGPKTYQEALDQEPDLEADPHECVVSHLQAARLRRELTRLPALEQRVLRWRYGIAGSPTLSQREIARRLRRTVASVRRLEESALQQLRSRDELRDEVA